MTQQTTSTREIDFIRIEVDPETGALVATSPVFGELVTQGDDILELADSLRDAIRTCVQHRQAEGIPLPPELTPQQSP